MSTLRSGLDELQAEGLDLVDDEGLEADVQELDRVERMVHAERARRLAEVDRRQTFRRDGFLSTTAWLVHRLGESRSRASDQVRCAKALRRMPATAEALSRGELPTSSVRILVAAREAHPEEFQRMESTLVDAARKLDAGRLFKAVQYWRQAMEHRRGAEVQDLRDHRYLHVSPMLDGMVRVDGELDPETGQTVISALDAVIDSELREADRDGRSPAQHRADALGEVCRQWLDRSDRPQVGGERPHVNVLVDLISLRGGVGHERERRELENTGPIHPEAARRIACDASVSRILMRGRSEPLDVGRRSPVVTSAMRRALVVRDGGCTFPGCGRPPRWTDAHHVVHWVDGGPTTLANLILLCRRHHRAIHVAVFLVEMREGRPEFRRADGSLLDERAPP
ncbi:MAG: DUF222 domain-containing protein [Actinomycetota bacterium]